MELKHVKSHIIENLNLLVLPISSFLLFFLSKPLFFIVMFYLLDYYKNILELKLYLNYFPIKIMEIGIITVSYLFSFKFGLILAALYFINKFLFGRFDDRSAYSTISIVTIAVFADIFSNLNFVVVSICLFILRYIIDFLVEFIFAGNIRLTNLPARAINTVIAYFVFLSMIFLM